ncbi:MAG: FAD-dependent oxidoreductase, partial [Elusimicrobiota bacterium]|nr:FAD-dependent oxidoreductase [Elusimicrobiota bacterium]
SCGKCVPCREGLYQSLKILKSITEGKFNSLSLRAKALQSHSQNCHSDILNELETLCNVIKDTALCGLGQTGPNPILTTLKYFRTEYEEHIAEKRCYAGICQTLFLSPCENSCPLNMNIPGFLELFKEDKIEEAFELILQDNPMPASTGRICHHPCEEKCRRADIDAPISKREVHRYIADVIYKQKKDKFIIKKLRDKKFADTGKKIAVVGAGPAGLTAAFYLSRLGHKVIVYESHSKPGGMLRLTIPEFRLPKSVLDKEIQNIGQLGVKFVLSTKIGTDKSLSNLEKEYDAVFLATGAQKEIALDIPGEDLTGVLSGVDFLEQVARNRKPKIGKKTI